MSYVRKTKDEYELQANYGYGDGFECICTEETHREIRQRLAEYRQNEGGNYRIVKRRVRIKGE